MMNLKPCPFCGSQDVSLVATILAPCGHRAMCRACTTQGPPDTDADVAVDMWNAHASGNIEETQVLAWLDTLPPKSSVLVRHDGAVYEEPHCALQSFGPPSQALPHLADDVERYHQDVVPTAMIPPPGTVCMREAFRWRLRTSDGLRRGTMTPDEAVRLYKLADVLAGDAR